MKLTLEPIADAAAPGLLLARGLSLVYKRGGLLHKCLRFQLAFDGGKRRGGAAAAWVLRGTVGDYRASMWSDRVEWVVLAEGSWGLGPEPTATAAEMCALLGGILSFESLRVHGKILLHHCDGADMSFRPWQSAN